MCLVKPLLQNITSHVNQRKKMTELCLCQVHTFYEAVGYMISAQVDTMAQDVLIEKYMMLPNQVWDDIISQASKVSI